MNFKKVVNDNIVKRFYLVYLYSLVTSENLLTVPRKLDHKEMIVKVRTEGMVVICGFECNRVGFYIFVQSRYTKMDS